MTDLLDLPKSGDSLYMAGYLGEGWVPSQADESVLVRPYACFVQTLGSAEHSVAMMRSKKFDKPGVGTNLACVRVV